MYLRGIRKYTFACLLLLCCLSLLSFPAMAQKADVPLDAEDIDSTTAEAPPALKSIMQDLEAEKNNSGSADIEIDGLIVDETVTKMGRDFYQVFYSNWEAPPNFRDYTLKLSEKPMRGIGTMIIIEINDQVVAESPLQPRYDIIESIAKQAVQVCYNYLMNYEQIQRDLSGEDLSGSGIY